MGLISVVDTLYAQIGHTGSWDVNSPVEDVIA